MKSITRIVLTLVSLALSVTAAITLAVVGMVIYFTPSLPDINNLQHYQLSTPLRIYSSDDKLIGEFGEQHRQIVSYDDLPPHLVNAFLAAEDQDFFHHAGVDPKGIGRALAYMAGYGKVRSGGSTITMQVARNYLLTLDQTFSRKIREIMLSLQMERILSKQQIFELYVNKIYLGQGAYGAGAAAQVYFNKPIDQLTLPEAATIAGLPKAPSAFNPVVNPIRSLDRRNWILSRMRQANTITEQQYRDALETPLDVRQAHSDMQLQAPYIAEMARQYAVRHFGEQAYTNGYTIKTTINSAEQEAARQALIDGLVAYDVRHGWRGVEQKGIPKTLVEAQQRASRTSAADEEQAVSADVKQATRRAAERSVARIPGIDGDVSNWMHELNNAANVGPLEPAIVVSADGQQIKALCRNGTLITLSGDDVRWAARARAASPITGDMIRVLPLKDGGWKLSQVPRIEGAIVVLDPTTGAIRALQGGFSDASSSFNRATQARRQPGSTFKPFIYLAALDQGNMTPATVLNDAPIVESQGGKVWRPENDNRTFQGPTRLRVGLYTSRNMIVIRALNEVGVDKAIDMLVRMGFQRDQMPPGLSLALGSASLTPLEMARGYAEIANGGFKVEPWYIQSVTQNDDPTNLLEQQEGYHLPPVACPNCSTTATTTTLADGKTYPVAERIVDPAAVYMIQDIMRDVIVRGTGQRASVLHRSDLSGKTGTSNDQRDAWFAGFNANLVTTVWVGMDNNSPTGEYGAQAALPIWVQFMGQALKGKPNAIMPPPDNIVRARIDPDSGLRLRDEQPGGISEVFRADNLPQFKEMTIDPELQQKSGSEGTASYDSIF
ncbi:penicillin-binding protein 1A [Zymobacter sp. IVIA_12111.31 C1]|uniref:penicillin-binding protein 1A n=1 Tax=Zymobacter sp. IVIA_12111.31 C1 TaxID=3394854 RepID=UPI0039C28C34